MTDQTPNKAVINQLIAAITQWQQCTDTHITPLLSDYIANNYLPWSREHKASYYDCNVGDMGNKFEKRHGLHAFTT